MPPKPLKTARFVPRGTVAIADVARKAGIGYNILGQQIRRGAYGRIALKRATAIGMPTVMLRERAQPIIDFHREHVILRKARGRLRRHVSTIERAIEILAGLPDDHPVLQKIGGPVKTVEKGGFAYLSKEDERRLGAFLKQFASANEIAKKAGVPPRSLLRELQAGLWPQAVMIRSKGKYFIHQSLISVIRGAKTAAGTKRVD